MEEKFRFQEALGTISTETEEYQKDSSALIEGKKKEQKINLQIQDISLKQSALSFKFGLLNTEVQGIVIRKQTILPLFDIFLTDYVIKNHYQDQIPVTDVTRVHIAKKILNFASIKLFAAKIDQFPTLLGTDVAKIMQIDKSGIKDFASRFDLGLSSETLLKQNLGLDTDLTTTNIESSLETIASSEGQGQLPILEEFINCDKRLPRNFSESFNSPFIVLIGEDECVQHMKDKKVVNAKEDRIECGWHIPIIYALNELFREITDKYPKVTFRAPELFEEGFDDIVDSLDTHSLGQFTLECKIEFLDARKMYLAVDEFAKIAGSRLKSGFLQQFGVLVIAIKPKYLEKAKEALIFGGIHVYTCKTDNAKYELFCSKIIGTGLPDKFFSSLQDYEKHLKNTHKKFSIFVKRGANNSDKLQYPLKVATFVYLLDELKDKRRKIISDFDEICMFANEILEKEKIKVEHSILEGKVIPDLIYSPEVEEIYVEIETLIGTFEPLKKIDETIEKYKDIPNATIWIILKPVSAMIHYDELKTRKKTYGILYNDKKIKFKVLSLMTTSKDKFRWNLVSINEFIRNKNAK